MNQSSTNLQLKQRLLGLPSSKEGTHRFRSGKPRKKYTNNFSVCNL